MSGPRHGSIRVTADLPLTYDLWEPDGSPRELLLLLHAFSHSGARIQKRLAPILPRDAAVLAPNGLFPCPQLDPASGSAQRGYSWYFYDPKSDDYLVDMSASIRGLAALVTELGYGGLPKRIIGFSQGGYLAPFLAKELREVRQVIGIGSRFLEEELVEQGVLPALRKLRLDGVHGAEDATVDPVASAASHAALRELGVSGEFRTVQGAEHRLSPEIVREVGNLLALV